MKPKFIIKLQDDCWVANWEGDPGRTLLPINAQRFDSREEAIKKLKECKKYRHLEHAKIVEI